MRILLTYEEWLRLKGETEGNFDGSDYIFMDSGIIIAKDTMDELRSLGFEDHEIIEMIEETVSGNPSGPFKDWEWDGEDEEDD